MLILGVDTTSAAGSLALWRDGAIAAVLVGDPSRTHGERLPGEIRALLSRANVSLGDVDLYAVVSGPGSFTGLRVGIAAVQGLALAGGRRVIPVSAFDAFASVIDLGEGRVGIWRDAQRRQVFALLVDRRGQGVTPLAAPVSRLPEEVAREWREQDAAPDAFIGDGVDAYMPIVHEAFPRARIVTPAPALAPLAAALAARRPEAAVAPHAVVPMYVRAPDAEIARERTKRDER